MSNSIATLTRYCTEHRVFLGTKDECGPCSMRIGPRLEYQALPATFVVPCWTFTIKAIEP